MDERVSRLRSVKEAEAFAANAERLGRPDLAEQARFRAMELAGGDRKKRREGKEGGDRRTRKAAMPRPADESLFLNGVFEGVLSEIEDAQAGNPGLVCYLQPYKPKLMRRLHKHPPTADSPWRLFMSVTRSLPLVSYEADIVEWHDKQSLSADEVARLNQRYVQHQPQERGLHMAAVDGQEAGRNLLGIVRLRRITPAIAVDGFTKLSDDAPLAPRTRAGGWSYVRAPQRREAFEIVSEKAWGDLTRDDVERAGRSSRAERRKRLAAATPLPEQVHVAVRMYRRNQDVIAEVLERANGHCEDCRAPAPFLRAKDGRPFLEVHHKVRLADGGPDTVENAIALCPNCHRKRHFGLVQEYTSVVERVALDIV